MKYVVLEWDGKDLCSVFGDYSHEEALDFIHKKNKEQEKKCHIPELRRRYEWRNLWLG